MRTRWRAALLAASLLLGASACSEPAPVIQGTVVEVDVTRLAVRDEAQAASEPVVLDVSAADMGQAPHAGDRVRVVYRREGAVNRALAVMNLTRQHELPPSEHR